MPYKDKEVGRAATRAAYYRNLEANRAAARARYAKDGSGKARAAARRAVDPQAHRDSVLNHYHRDVKAARAKRRAYYHAHPERHREIARAAHAALMERNPEAFRARVRARWALEKGAEGSCNAEQWSLVLDVYGTLCLRCGSVEDITQDHVVPLSAGGTHWPWNLQPLCRSCNSAKGGRNSDDYRHDYGEAILLLLKSEAA